MQDINETGQKDGPGCRGLGRESARMDRVGRITGRTRHSGAAALVNDKRGSVVADAQLRSRTEDQGSENHRTWRSTSEEKSLGKSSASFHDAAMLRQEEQKEHRNLPTLNRAFLRSGGL